VDNLHELVSRLIVDTKGSSDSSFFSITADSSLAAFLPELLLCATILAMLFVRLFSLGKYVNAFYIALPGTLAALYFAASAGGMLGPAGGAGLHSGERMEIFTGMLVYDSFSVFIRAALLLFGVLFLFFTKISGIPDHDDGPDIYTLVLGSTLGMCLMASANHLLMVFMGVEMASVPSYVLAGLMKGRRQASEASLKYAVYGAGAAGVMLYGISLLAGLLNTAHLPTMAQVLAEKLHTFQASEQLVLVFGALLISVGIAFKLSAVPFHFWCPDVFEGATAEVNAFLSVASKAAALALLVRVVVGIGMIAPHGHLPGERTAAMAKPTEASVALFNVAEESVKPGAAHSPSDAKPHDSASADATAALLPVRDFMGKVIAFFAIITCTFGNLAAYGQTNIKRLLAYSTIAHAGYMMMAVAALIALAGVNSTSAKDAAAALAIYVGVYLFMNLGAFAVVAFLRNAMRSENIADYAGLIRRCPMTVICFAAILFSLIGLPPLAGFYGKFAIFASLADGYTLLKGSGAGFYLMLLLVVGGINTAISLFYYLRVVKVMTIDPEPRDRPPFAYSDVSLAGAYLWLITLPTLALMIYPSGLTALARAAAEHLF
jgi:NADH-quinone oxidoreductase subunit N